MDQVGLAVEEPEVVALISGLFQSSTTGRSRTRPAGILTSFKLANGLPEIMKVSTSSTEFLQNPKKERYKVEEQMM